MISVAEARAISANNSVLLVEVEEYVSNKILAAANNGEFSTSVPFLASMWKSKYNAYAKIAARVLNREGYNSVRLSTCPSYMRSDLDISWDNV